MNRSVNLGVGCIVVFLLAATAGSAQTAIGSMGYSPGCDCGPGTGACTERDPGDAGTRLKALLAPNRPPGNPAPETPAVRERLRAIAAAGLPKELFDFWRGLASLESLHIQAQVESWISAKANERSREAWSAAEFELWEAGERYRFSAPIPTALGLSQVAEAAFDGSRFEMYLRDSGIVTIGSTDSRNYSLPLRSPLALVADYLNPNDQSACGGCQLRLADLRAVAPALVQSEQASQGALLRTPDAKYGAQVAVGYRLQYKPVRRGVTSTIEQVTARGQVLSRIQLTNFNPVPGHPDLLFPWAIVHEVLDDRGKQPILRHTYQIEFIEADKPIPDSVFRLSTAGGRHVWDDDNRIHVQ